MLTSCDNENGTIENLDPENMEIAVAILLPCALSREKVKYPDSPLAGKRRKKPLGLPGQGLTNSHIW